MFYDWWLSFKTWAQSLVLTISDMLKDVFLWIMEQLFSVVLIALDGMGSLFEGLNVAPYLTALPSGARWMLDVIGFGTAMGMIVSAIIIRVMLQLIPFTRLGS